MQSIEFVYFTKASVSALSRLLEKNILDKGSSKILLIFCVAKFTGNGFSFTVKHREKY